MRKLWGLLLLPVLPLLGQCNSFWGGFAYDEARNCVQHPAACSATEACNRLTELCEPAIVLSAVTPAHGPTSGQLMLTLTGAGFNPGDRVRIGTVFASEVQVVASTTITATLPAQPGSCGPVPVTVIRADGLEVTQPRLFSYYTTNLVFSMGGLINTPANSGNSGVVLGDFNGDGKLDCAVSAKSANVVNVALGDGLGGFGPLVAYGVGNGPAAISAIDINNDQKLDLVTANSSPPHSSVSILVGDGAAGFVASTPLPPAEIQSYSPSAVVPVDWDHDGNVDLILAADIGCSLLLGDGKGSYSLGTIAGAKVFTSAGPGGAAVGIFGPSRALSLLLGQSGNTLNILTQRDPAADIAMRRGEVVAMNSVMTGPTPSPVMVDLNQDGALDLVALNRGSSPGSLSVVLGTGMSPSTMTVPVTVATTDAYPYRAAVADFNCDAQPDLAVLFAASNFMSVMLGDGHGGLASAIRLPLPANQNETGIPRDIAVGDLNGDGKPDLLISQSSGVVSLLNMSQ